MPTDKIARSRSADPVQEHLRERKQAWNKACSAFIARLNAFKPHLISFKRGLNGRGDPKAGIPISNIKDPLPTEVAAYLGGANSEFGELASTFATLVSEANGIIQEQADYSMKRRKSQNKVIQLRRNEQSLPIAADHQDSEDALFIEGSGSLSRFWANLSHTLSPSDVKEQRLSMLKMSHDLFKDLVDLEDLVLSKGLDNVEDIYNSYSHIADNIKSLRLSFNRLKNNTNSDDNTKKVINNNPPSNIPDTQKPQQPASVSNDFVNDVKPTPVALNDLRPSANIADYNLQPVTEDSPLSVLKDNILIMRNSKYKGFDTDDVRPFLKLFNARARETNLNDLELMEDRLRVIYEQIYDYFVELHKEASVQQLNLVKESASPSSIRLLKRLRNLLTMKDSASASRTVLFKEIRTIKKYVDEVMDLLEDFDSNINDIDGKMSKVEEHIIKMIEPLHILYVLYKPYYVKKKKDKSIKNKNKNIFDPADRYFTQQLRRDVDIDK